MARSEIITPGHTIAPTGASVNLACNSTIVENRVADNFEWQLLYKPEGSSASFTGDGAYARISIDAEGFYVIRLSAYNNNMLVGTDYAYVGTPSVVHYVWSGASGNGTGSDWGNALSNLPDKLERGHTYFIADGTYPPYYCNPEPDREIPVYIIKAVPAAHGTDTGWNNGTMGVGQAVFVNSAEKARPPFMLNAGYVVIDGQVGKGKGDVERHGFMFSNILQQVDFPFVISHFLGNGASVENVSLKHAEIVSVRSRGFQVHSMASCAGLLLHGCYIHDCHGITIYFVNTSYSTVEYCHIARNHSDAEHHAEGIQSGGSSPYNVIRFNTWEDIEGTAVIAGDTGWKVYGNLVFYSAEYINTDPAGRHEPGVECGFLGMGLYTTNGGGSRPGNRIYNNTVVGGYPPNGWKSGTNFGYSLSGEDNLVCNNLWSSCPRIPRLGGTHDYNMYHDNNRNNQHLEPVAEEHVQYVTSDPFVDSSAYDFRLAAESVPGAVLDPEYSFDMYGNMRGADGVWTRGAFEFR